MSPAKPTLWIYLAVAIALVLLGGAFAGLTIALMGQVRVPISIFFVYEVQGGLAKTCGHRMRYICRLLRSLERGGRRVMPRVC